MAGCCPCSPKAAAPGRSLPLICLVPRDAEAQVVAKSGSNQPQPQPPKPVSTDGPSQDSPLLDEEYVKKHFKLPPRPLYLDPFRRPLITFPMTQEIVNHFNMARKTKINQQILDGYLDPSEAISAPSVFPYAQTKTEKEKSKAENEEIIYILQLPDWEFKCPVHHHVVKTPRPLARPGFDVITMSAPMLMQIKPDGKFEDSLPASTDEENRKLRAVVQYLINNKSISAAQTYCCKCIADYQLNDNDKFNYVPIIMMPISSADQCPFDMEHEIVKTKEIAPKKKFKNAIQVKETEKEKQKVKKHGFVLQRLTDFDLLSQW